MGRKRLLAGVGVAAMLAAAPAFAEEAIPVGPEFRVSRGNPDYYSYTYDGRAYDVDVARTPNGQFVVVWQERAETYGGYTEHQTQRIEARRFNRDGSGAGQQFTILQGDEDYFYDEERLFHPSVAARPDNGFVVVWGNNYDAPPASFGRVWAQRFSAGNAPLAAPVQVNSAEADVNQFRVNEVATDPSGGFIVTWDSHAFDPAPDPDVIARRFDAAGVPLGPEFKVNTNPIDWYGFPDVATDAAGNFVIVWQNQGFDTPPPATLARQFDTAGAPLGPEITVFDHDNDVTKNKVAVTPDGHFMATGWGGSVAGTPGRIFDSTGAPVTPEFEIDPNFTYATVTSDLDGNFVVTWVDYSEYVVSGRRFSSSGAPLGAEFQVSQQEVYSVFEWPAAATDEDGDFVVVWTNDYYDNGYNYTGLWGRRFAVCGNAHVGPDDACDDGNTTALDGCSATCKVETCHTCSGDPSACPQMPGCTAVCTNPAFIPPNTAALSFKGIGNPVGDEGLAFKGKILTPPLEHLEWNPSTDGIELALTTTSLVYGIFGTTALPPGPPGSGCDPMRDGWKVKPGLYVYKNASNALPPACIPGSANGVRVVKVKDKLDRDATIQFRVKARNASIAVAPAPPLTATVILGTSPGAGAAGRCGQITFTGAIGTRFFP